MIFVLDNQSQITNTLYIAMPNLPQSDNATKSVRVKTEAWEEASHLAVDMRSNMVALFTVAWKQFMMLPEGRRAKLVRDYESEPKTTAA